MATARDSVAQPTLRYSAWVPPGRPTAPAPQSVREQAAMSDAREAIEFGVQTESEKSSRCAEMPSFVAHAVSGQGARSSARRTPPASPWLLAAPLEDGEPRGSYDASVLASLWRRRWAPASPWAPATPVGSGDPMGSGGPKGSDDAMGCVGSSDGVRRC